METHRNWGVIHLLVDTGVCGGVERAGRFRCSFGKDRLSSDISRPWVCLLLKTSVCCRAKSSSASTFKNTFNTRVQHCRISRHEDCHNKRGLTFCFGRDRTNSQSAVNSFTTGMFIVWTPFRIYTKVKKSLPLVGIGVSFSRFLYFLPPIFLSPHLLLSPSFLHLQS